MNRLERVQTITAQVSEMRDSLKDLLDLEEETPTTRAITQLALLAATLADVTATILAETSTRDDK